VQIRVNALKNQGKKIAQEEENALLAEITEQYNQKLHPYYAASRLWVDGVIDPLETRKIISMGIEAANHAPLEKFSVGVIQT
jgi:acetyl-CoA carboxylase carboxyltransferase component